MPAVLVPLANGVEEMEAVIIVDTLRRAEIEVVTVAIETSKTITASRGVVLVADALWSEVDASQYDGIILPGGAAGSDALSHHMPLIETLREFDATDKFMGAICAGTLVLQAAGILTNRAVTCHPGVAAQLVATARQNGRVVKDGELITSQGPGTSFEFALAIIEHLTSTHTATTVAAGLILPSEPTRSA
jgi:4-methyl-5(b-hydroxyethyl)-thiazole monophosphate biosynthesis